MTNWAQVRGASWVGAWLLGVVVPPAHAADPAIRPVPPASVTQSLPGPASREQFEGNAPATEVTADKSGYTLFNPTPDNLLRAFSTDRPGKTHSSTTVDAGHFQVEADFYNYTYSHFTRDQTTLRYYIAPNPLFKVGVTNWADIEVNVQGYSSLEIRSRTGGGTLRGAGLGDVFMGSKISLFGNDVGNDPGTQSLAVIPSIKLPTAGRNVGNNLVEFFVNYPYTLNFQDNWALTIEPASNLVHNATKQGYHGDFQMLLNLSHPVFADNVTAAIEVAAATATDHNICNRYTLDPSIQWLVTPTLQLDAGIYIGLNKDTPNYNPYIGISARY